VGDRLVESVKLCINPDSPAAAGGKLTEGVRAGHRRADGGSSTGIANPDLPAIVYNRIAVVPVTVGVDASAI